MLTVLQRRHDVKETYKSLAISHVVDEASVSQKVNTCNSLRVFIFTITIMKADPLLPYSYYFKLGKIYCHRHVFIFQPFKVLH